MAQSLNAVVYIAQVYCLGKIVGQIVNSGFSLMMASPTKSDFCDENLSEA
jgi:hypothetical protein